MGSLVELHSTVKSIVAICPNCESERWFIELDDTDPETDQDLIDSIIAVRCVDCDATYIVERDQPEIIFESDFDLEGDKDGNS